MKLIKLRGCSIRMLGELYDRYGLKDLLNGLDSSNKHKLTEFLKSKLFQVCFSFKPIV